LKEKYGDIEVHVEPALKETRVFPDDWEPDMSLSDFLDRYKNEDLYLVSQTHPSQEEDIPIFPSLRCGGYLNFLNIHQFWMGHGSAKSVIHNDDVDNLNCMLSGKKRFIIFEDDEKFTAYLPDHPDKNEFGFVSEDTPGVKSYGEYAAKIDVDAVDLITYPRWSEVDYWVADLEAGDCLFIPYKWMHQVRSFEGRTVNLQLWFSIPERFEANDCVDESLTWGHCKFDFESREDELFGRGRKTDPEQTSCHPFYKEEL